MATNRWRGDAPAIAQIQTITFGTWDATTTYKFTINGKVISGLGNVGGATTAATLATAFLALLAPTPNTTPPEFQEITWTNPSSAVIVGTAKTAGIPFTVTTSVSGGTGTFTSNTTTTTSSGPSDVSLAQNWSTGSLPGNGDDVYIDTGSSLLYNLAQFVANTFNSLQILQSFTGTIGLPEINKNNTAVNGSYYEYRQKYFQSLPTTINIGKGTGSGSGRIKLDCGATAFTCNVYNTGNSLDAPGVGTLQIKGTNAANILNVTKGSVSIAPYPTETATIATLTVGFFSNVNGDSQVFCSNATTLTTVKQTGGTLYWDGNVTTFTMINGEAWQYSGNLTTLNLFSGTFHYLGAGTLTNWLVGTGGFLDFTENNQSRIIAAKGNLYKGAKYHDTLFTVTNTNGFALIGCDMSDVDVENGDNRTYVVT